MTAEQAAIAQAIGDLCGSEAWKEADGGEALGMLVALVQGIVAGSRLEELRRASESWQALTAPQFFEALKARLAELEAEVARSRGQG